ncbi:hypothetical protein N302_10686, partial [Corvus brachyrhynchos]
SSPAALGSCNEFSCGAGHSHPCGQREATLGWYLEIPGVGGKKIYSILFSYLVPKISSHALPSLPSQEEKSPVINPQPGGFPFWKSSA